MALKLGHQSNTFVFPSLLRSCPHIAAGESLHADATKRGFTSDPYIATSIVAMYSDHHSFSNARKMFDEVSDPNYITWNSSISSFFRAGNSSLARELFDCMPCPNAITWSAMISGYAQNGQAKDSLRMFVRMRREFVSLTAVNSDIVAGVLSACAQSKDLSFGQQVHGYTMKISSFVEDDEFVGTVLVEMYGKCGYMEFARRSFNSMVNKNVVAWSSLIANYVNNHEPLMATKVFKEMIHGGAAPNNVTLTSLISACAYLMRITNGKELHGYLTRRRLEKPDLFISTALIDMYGKLGATCYARRILDKEGDLSNNRSMPMWNAMISGFAVNGLVDDVWNMIRYIAKSSNNGVQLNSVTMAIILPICGRSTLLLYGKEIHCYALKNNLDRDLLVGNGLLDMYSKCGKVGWAKNQFCLMPEKNRISWTALIDGYGMNNEPQAAIDVFNKMVMEKNIEPDHITFVALISACSHSGFVDAGLRYFNAMTREYGIKPREENYGSLVDLLARAGYISEARCIAEAMPVMPGANVWGALLGASRIHGDVGEGELAASNLLELDSEKNGFRALLCHIYAGIGRLDCIAKVRRPMDEGSVNKRHGCSWMEAK
ncbi:putative tetratricopeptide-like helical domain superfamily [Dioscorea sansibarensis]